MILVALAQTCVIPVNQTDCQADHAPAQAGEHLEFLSLLRNISYTVLSIPVALAQKQSHSCQLTQLPIARPVTMHLLGLENTSTSCLHFLQIWDKLSLPTNIPCTAASRPMQSRNHTPGPFPMLLLPCFERCCPGRSFARPPVWRQQGARGLTQCPGSHPVFKHKCPVFDGESAHSS